jgi:hypothetical protein
MSSQAAEEGRTTPLEVFLATSMLATDTDTQDAKNDKNADVRPCSPLVFSSILPFF